MKAFAAERGVRADVSFGFAGVKTEVVVFWSGFDRLL